MRVNTLMTDTGNTYVPSLSYQLTVNNSSYGDSLYMDEKAVEDVIEIINELSRKFYEVFSDLLLVEDSLRKKGEASGWWSTSRVFAPDLFYNQKNYNF